MVPPGRRTKPRIAFKRIDDIDGHNPGSKIPTVDVATAEIRFGEIE